ncbi:MAG: glycosyltransferase family 4 protein [Lentisphaeria bacterium]|nr:glycosyltransferase family 4 protein [Lentisphaeria bacterium]
MRVAFLTMGNDIGGAKNDVITLSQELLKRGHKVFVISNPGVMDRELEGTGVTFLPAPFYTRNPFGLLRASRRLAAMIREHRIGLVNPQGMFPAAIAWLTRFGPRPCRIPLVTTIHMISSLSLYKWSWLLNIFANAVITESNCERSRLVAGGVKRGRVTVIANSVDMERFSRRNSTPVLRREFGLAESVPVFGIIARLSPEKRHGDFIAAARMVRAKHPEARFFIVGGGPCEAELRRVAEGTEPYVHFTGQRRDVPDILRSLDCFVLASGIESLPLSIREAMSMELPVIVTDVGGCREAVFENVTGFVVPAAAPAAMAARMNDIIEDPERAKELGRAGRLLCARCFEVSEWGRKTEEFFRKWTKEEYEHDRKKV